MGAAGNSNPYNDTQAGYATPIYYLPDMSAKAPNGRQCRALLIERGKLCDPVSFSCLIFDCCQSGL